jgi:GTP cyclohydrolase II
MIYLNQQHNMMHNPPLLKNSSIYFLGLLTWAVVIVQALATSPSTSSHNSFSRNQWGVSRGGSVASSKPRTSSSLKSLAEDNSDIQASGNTDSEEGAEIPSPFIGVLNGASITNHQASELHVNIKAFPSAAAATSTKTHVKKTIVTPGGFADAILPATYVAETNLPTDIGHYRIRAYRINSEAGEHPLGAGAGLGSEPCVINCTDKPPFGKRGVDVEGAKGVPVRIHDQCFTSEVFRSQR